MQMASRGQAHRNSLAHTSHGTRRPHSSGCPLQQSATEIPRQDGQGYHGAGQLGSRQPSTEPQVHRRTEALRDGGGATPPHLFFFFFFHLKTKHSLRVKYVRAITTNTRNIKTVAHPRCAVNASLLLGTRAVVGCLAVVLPHAGVPEIAGCAYWSDDGVRTEGGVASTVACCTL